MLLATAECYWVRSLLKPISYTQLGFVVVQIILSTGLELLNAYLMYKIYFEKRNLNTFKYCMHCFSDLRLVICGLPARMIFLMLALQVQCRLLLHRSSSSHQPLRGIREL